MKNISLFLTLSFFMTSGSVLAATRLQFFPGGRNGMIVVKSGGLDGNSDSDFSKLSTAMNVAPQDSMLGKAKTIKTPEQDFTLICSDYQTQCQLFLQKSSRVIMAPTSQKMKFEAHGDAADALTTLFEMSGDRRMEFYTEDRKFHLKGIPGYFLFEASEAGVL